ncbi:hypothetical protein Trydic_g5609 [Trypoxylus dichotomus]
MMLCKRFIVILGFFTLSVAYGENTTSVPLENATQPSISPSLDYVPVYTLQYDIREDKISQLTFELVIQEPFYSQVNTEDILNLLESQNLIIRPKLIDIQFETILDIVDIEIIDILHTLTQYVPPKKLSNIKNILTGFNIDFNEYQEYFIEVDNGNMHKLVANGNYTEATIQNALAIMQKTEKEVVLIIKDILLDKLKEAPISTVVTEFAEQLEELLYKRGISRNDLIQYSTLNNMLNNFRAALRNQTFWATGVSANSLVSVLQAFENIRQYSFYVTANVTNIKDRTIQIVENIVPNSTFSLITIPQNLSAYVDIEYNSTRRSGCYYFTSNGQEVSTISVEGITLMRNGVLIENNSTLHQLGSPLICQNRLHGILVNQDQTRLIFLTFGETQNSSGVIPTWTEESVGGSGQNLYANILLVIGICITIIS